MREGSKKKERYWCSLVRNEQVREGGAEAMEAYLNQITKAAAAATSPRSFYSIKRARLNPRSYEPRTPAAMMKSFCHTAPKKGTPMQSAIQSSKNEEEGDESRYSKSSIGSFHSFRQSGIFSQEPPFEL